MFAITVGEAGSGVTRAESSGVLVYKWLPVAASAPLTQLPQSCDKHTNTLQHFIAYKAPRYAQ